MICMSRSLFGSCPAIMYDRCLGFKFRLICSKTEVRTTLSHVMYPVPKGYRVPGTRVNDGWGAVQPPTLRQKHLGRIIESIDPAEKWVVPYRIIRVWTTVFSGCVNASFPNCSFFLFVLLVYHVRTPWYPFNSFSALRRSGQLRGPSVKVKSRSPSFCLGVLVLEGCGGQVSQGGQTLVS